ncbi:mercury(II) reductase [Thermoflavifilum thermophilum]|uniref:Mercuric reductase n=1 Tax=Thermoflavifilum thermophilum TaxID=1393122 RepID=A0A1I7NE33_9BACT|nr:mercury(II) reductase [Thermoflavifilum thermophilum]SFV32806.1 mercuric reductase [Thermoflavifilum thermophilum]
MAQSEIQHQTAQLDITGMTCTHCAATIQKLLLRQPGVREARVDYPTGKGIVVFDPKQIRPEQIQQVIDQTPSYRVSRMDIGLLVSPKEENGYDYRLIIIGGGSAAFAAAIRAEELGLKTLMINDGLPIGGTCVNVGCVPSKTLIRTAEAAFHARHSFFDAVRPRGADIDFPRVIRDKQQLVETLRQQKYLNVVQDFEHLKILSGHARLDDSHTVVVDEKMRYTGEKILLATGSRPRIPDIPGLKEVGYLTNRSLFELEEKPESLTIMGAGYVGCEIATAYRRLGVKIRIIEFTDRILRSQTPDISEELARHMQAEGIEIWPNFRAKRLERKAAGIQITGQFPDGRQHTFLEPGHVVVATGIQANVEGLGLEAVGVQLAGNGHIAVNDFMQTSVPHIYAAGDVANTPAYVYTAAYEAKIAVNHAFAGGREAIDYRVLPWVIFTDPQVAGVGMDEAQADQLGIPYEVSKLSLREIPRALAARDTRGFIKLIRHAETDQLLGARVVAPEGGELIMTLSLAMKYRIPVQELAAQLFPYLTLQEGIKLAALAFSKDVQKLSCCAS